SRSYGLEPGDLGAIFTSNGRRFKLTGIVPSRPKYPLDGECLSTGKTFKFTRGIVSQIAATRGQSATPPAPKAPNPIQAAMNARIAGGQQQTQPVTDALANNPLFG